MSQPHSQQHRRTPLYENHIQRNAKLIPFNNYSLPVWFSSIKAEHQAVRESAGIFDIGHMGVLCISGDTAFSDLQRVSCNDVTKSHTGKMVYSMLLNESGGILDDVMIGCLREPNVTSPALINAYIMVTNAANTEKITSWISKFKQPTTTLTQLNTTYSLVALQGPMAPQIFNRVFSVTDEIIPFSVRSYRHLGLNADTLIMGTGYTGETGVELLIPNPHVGTIWNELIEYGATPCGLGARDTLRLEKGFPLYGQELSIHVHPLMTRYPWVVDWNHDFIGKTALQQLTHPTMKTVGLKMESRQIARTGDIITSGGQVTSGTLSPSLNIPISMAIIPIESASIGNTVTIQSRGKYITARVCKVPFTV